MKLPLVSVGLLATSLILRSRSLGESPRTSLTKAENSYAELMDASSVLTAIDSGLFIAYEGRGRVAWEETRAEKYKEVAARLAKISARDLPAADARALMLMQKGVETISLAQSSLHTNYVAKMLKPAT